MSQYNILSAQGASKNEFLKAVLLPKPWSGIKIHSKAAHGSTKMLILNMHNKMSQAVS